MEALSEMEKRAGSVAHVKDELARKDAEIERLKLSIAELQSSVGREDKIENWQNGKKEEDREEELEELQAVMQANQMCINSQENEIEKLTRSLELQKKKNDVRKYFKLIYIRLRLITDSLFFSDSSHLDYGRDSGFK